MRKRPSVDYFTRSLGTQVTATELSPTLTEPLYPEYWEGYIFPEEEADCEPALLRSKKVSDEAFEWFDPPTNGCIYYGQDSTEAGEQLIAGKATNLARFEPIDDIVTGLIVGAEYNAQRTVAGVPVLVKARVKPIVISYGIIVNSFATNVVKTTWIYS